MKEMLLPDESIMLNTAPSPGECVNWRVTQKKAQMTHSHSPATPHSTTIPGRVVWCVCVWKKRVSLFVAKRETST